MRHEQAGTASRTLVERIARVQGELESHSESVEGEGASEEAYSEDRIEALEAELAEIDVEREREVEREIQGLAADHEQASKQVAELEQKLGEARTARGHADTAAEAARERLRASEREVEATRREAARVGAELAAVNQFLRIHASKSLGRGGADAPKALSETLQVQAGYELALAAVLGSRLDAAVVDGLAQAESLLDGAGQDGGAALLAGEPGVESNGGQGHEPMGQDQEAPISPGQETSISPGQDAPMPGAQLLADLVQGPQPALGLAKRLLADAWVVERLDDLPANFNGVATTRSGRVWLAKWGEVRQMAEGGAERVLARRNERDALIAASETAVQAEHAAKAAAEEALQATRAAEQAREDADGALRAAERGRVEGVEEQRRLAWLIEQRRVEPEQGTLAVRRAQLEGELASEQRQAERVARERAERKRRLESLRAQLAGDTALTPVAQRLVVALHSIGEAVAERVSALEQELTRDREAGEAMAAELSACAGEEAEIQARLRAQGEAVTSAEVAAQRLRDQFAEAELELSAVLERLGDVQGEESEPLGEEEAQALRARVERLQRRREQLGPVNPLAQEEYAEALEHVEEMEVRRTDLETALRELRGVIRDTDRQIHETFHATFTAAANNFEELVGDVFPGGSGRLRLVREEPTRRAVLGGQSPGEKADPTDADAEAAAESEAEQEEYENENDALEGVEIEITPAGKSTKRLSLLSGGEKSMTALAFLFAVFLARPCPFYILDEVEAALDDLNLDRFLALLRRYAGRAQFIVITHQKRTMEAADWLYGVSMGGDGVSKILSRRLPPAEVAMSESAEDEEAEDSASSEDSEAAAQASQRVTKAA